MKRLYLAARVKEAGPAGPVKDERESYLLLYIYSLYSGPSRRAGANPAAFGSFVVGTVSLELFSLPVTPTIVDF